MSFYYRHDSYAEFGMNCITCTESSDQCSYDMGSYILLDLKILYFKLLSKKINYQYTTMYHL